MTKRQKLNYNNNELVQNLKQSTGKGVDAFFSSQPPTPLSVEPEIQTQDTSKQPNKETRKQVGNVVTQPENLPASQEVSHENLEPASLKVDFDPDPPQKTRLYRKQTFEFSKEDLDFLDEVKFQLREIGMTKNEIVRAGLELLAKDYQVNKETSFLVRKFGGQFRNNNGYRKE